MGIWKFVKSIFRDGKPGKVEKAHQELQDRINYHFNDIDLLKVALTHRSFAKSNDNVWLPSNERLEFLGDSILGVIVSEFLYAKYPDKLEGDLTKLKSLLVNETTLWRTANALDLGQYTLLSQEEDRAGGRSRASINADAFESVIGAIYLDGGLEEARRFVDRHILTHIDKIASDETFRNYKGELLEHLQSMGTGMPRYEVSSEDGPDHNKTFTVVVFCNGRKIGVGSGFSKKDAEQKAAAQALATLNDRL
jgi:ribonuclease-3